jgi:serine/threonine protein kinase
LEEARRDSVAVYYKVHDPALRRHAMLKILDRSVAAGQTMLHRFLREAQVLAATQHPNIIELHDVGESEGVAYMGMEWLEGRTMAENYDGTPWPIGRAVRLMEGVAHGADALRKRGIVHRDINPAAILMTLEDQPKIMSAFWARAIDDSPVPRAPSGVAIGAPGYMPPEQAADSQLPVGSAADVYSLGIVLYELLMGRRPIDNTGGGNPQASPPRREVPELPTALEAILATCMEYDPALRFPNAGALADALRSVSETLTK